MEARGKPPDWRTMCQANMLMRDLGPCRWLRAHARGARRLQPHTHIGRGRREFNVRGVVAGGGGHVGSDPRGSAR